MAQSEQIKSPRRARPQSVLAQDFSAALDEMFKLNGLGALELSVEEKKDDLQSQKLHLTSLESRLRETTDRLQKLEAKHRRSQSQNVLGGSGSGGRRPTVTRPAIVQEREEEEETEESGEGTETGTDDSGGEQRLSR